MNNESSQTNIDDIVQKHKNMNGKQQEEILKSLKPEDAEKVRNIMNNPEMTKKIRNAPQAQALMKKLMGGKHE